MSKPRPIASGILKIRELQIPVKLFTAASAQAVNFNLLHAKDLSRIQQKIYCPVDDAIIDRSELVRGFQVEKGKYVTFSDAELANLEDELIEISAFVRIETVDPVHFDAAYLVGCELTSADAYRTLATAMSELGCGAIAALTLHGREHPALIRPVYTKEGFRLVLHTLFHAGEVHSFEGIDEAARGHAGRAEIDLLKTLIAELPADFDPSKYSDRYRERIIEAARVKLARGREAIGEKPAPGIAKSVDLAKQLRASLATKKSAGRKRPATARESVKPTKRSANRPDIASRHAGF